MGGARLQQQRPVAVGFLLIWPALELESDRFGGETRMETEDSVLAAQDGTLCNKREQRMNHLETRGSASSWSASCQGARCARPLSRPS